MLITKDGYGGETGCLSKRGWKKKSKELII
jgi:hypothetical protein